MMGTNRLLGPLDGVVLEMALKMDLPASKSSRPAPYKQAH
jgi:hypothetical protein